MKPLLPLAALALSVTATAAEPITVLGLPLGGKLKMPIKQCTLKEVTVTDAPAICWVDAPMSHKGWRSGGIKVPKSSTRPEWAAHGTFRAYINNDGTLTSFAITTYRYERSDQIVASIAHRFGRPSKESPGETYLALWDKTEIRIQVLCDPRLGCKTDFTIPDRSPEALRAAARAKAIEAARPIAP